MSVVPLTQPADAGHPLPSGEGFARSIPHIGQLCLTRRGDISHPILYSGPNASMTFPGVPLPPPTKPEPMKTIPPATVAPGCPSDPPRAAIPFFVWNSTAVLNSHNT